jgi:hypothetical protein
MISTILIPLFRAKPDRAAASRLYQNGRGAPWVCDRSFGRPWRLFGSASCPTTSGHPRAWVRKNIPPVEVPNTSLAESSGSGHPSAERRSRYREPPLRYGPVDRSIAPESQLGNPTGRRDRESRFGNISA